MRSTKVLFFLATMLSITTGLAAQTGRGPACDFQFLRNGRRLAEICVCFQRRPGDRVACCIRVDADATNPTRPTTPPEMAAAMCQAINGCNRNDGRPANLMCTNPGPDICCVTSTAGDAVRRWSVTRRDGAGAIRNVGPGPTDPANPGAAAAPAPPGIRRRPIKVQINGVPRTPARFDLQAHGGPLVSLPVAAGSAPAAVATLLAAELDLAGYTAVHLGGEVSFLGDVVEVVELRALPDGRVPEKLLLVSYEEDIGDPSPPASLIGVGLEFGEEGPKYVGNGSDVDQLVHVGGAPSDPVDDCHLVHGGDLVAIDFVSPGGALSGSPFLSFVQIFPTSTPPRAVLLPGDAFATFPFDAALPTIIVFPGAPGSQLLDSAGVSFVMPLALAGTGTSLTSVCVVEDPGINLVNVGVAETEQLDVP